MLDRYLARIQWTAPRPPTLGTLAGLLRAHMTRIPFENIDVLLGRAVRLDLDSVWAKLVDARRGGYCFEHGTLLQAVLAAIGFQPVAHTARVIWLKPKAEAPLTHMSLSVPVDGRRFVLDPGFGGHAPLVPIPLEDGHEACAGADRHRLRRRDDEWVLETWLDGRLAPLWSSSLEPAQPADFVMANHFVSTFPESPFVTGLMLRAFAAIGRVSMLNRTLTIRRADGVETRVVPDRAALRALLAEHFGFDLPDVERLRVPSVPEWDT